MLSLRELRPSERETAGQLLAAAYPHRGHEVRSWDRPDPREHPQRWAAFPPSSSVLAGYAALWRVQLRKYRFDVIVAPDGRRDGVGSALLATVLEEAARSGAQTLQARAYASCPDALAFLKHRQFVETMQMIGFVLDLSAVDPRGLSARPDDSGADEIAIARVCASDIEDPTFWLKLSALQDAAVEGWPDPDPGGPANRMSVDDLKNLLLSSAALPLAFYVARRDDELVAYSSLAALQAPGEVQFRATAVRPDCRNRGLATALRARCLTIAKDAGYRTARSTSGNPAMIRINATFGFHEMYREVRLVRRLASA